MYEFESASFVEDILMILHGGFVAGAIVWD